MCIPDVKPNADRKEKTAATEVITVAAGGILWDGNCIFYNRNTTLDKCDYSLSTESFFREQIMGSMYF